jgi:serine/threonine protein kinase
VESSQFSNTQPRFESIEPIDTNGATCDAFCVKLYGKLHFLKRLKAEYACDIRYQEAQRKEYETGYRLEHPNLVRYISLTDDGILMEYVDGETLTDRLAKHPEYFNKQNIEKFLHQLLDAVNYLHSHQVLHLDLKPDNIMLTRINSDVKLTDLGCCYTDTFTDTQGRTNAFAAPEQLSGSNVDERTDIYAIGKILQLLPNHHIYNNVIAQCIAEKPQNRYQSIDELKKNISSYNHFLLPVIVLLLILISSSIAIFYSSKHTDAPIVIQKEKDTIIQVTKTKEKDTIVKVVGAVDNVADQPHVAPTVIEPKPQPPAPVPVYDGNAEQLKAEFDKQLDQAYEATIATFCDSVFPSPTTGIAWRDKTSDFQIQTLDIAAKVARRYPYIPEKVIMQHGQSRYQSLVGYVFAKMRRNGEKK